MPTTVTMCAERVDGDKSPRPPTAELTSGVSKPTGGGGREGARLVKVGSPRLRIEPARHEWLEALVEGDSVFESRFGVDVSPGWSGFPEALPHMRDAARRSPLDPWGTHLLFDEATGTPSTLIGVGGWKGSPSARGEAELGYAVATGYQGRCVATAFVRELIASGRVAGVATAVAHTMPSESASTGVLRRCGFRNVATVASGSDAGTESSVWR